MRTMTRRMWGLGLAASLVLFGLERRTTAAPPGIVERDGKDPRWVAGQIIAASPPDAIWTRLQRVDTWPSLFSDIQKLRVVRHDGAIWRVNLETVTFNCGAHDYDVAFKEGRTVDVRIDAPGVDAYARVLLLDGVTPAETRIVYQLFAQSRGVVGWFISDAVLRRKQDEMAARYLRDLDSAFNPARR